ncbi:hypothetical protein M0802_013550 [Mischocyttarus mexicanus]|nr:hypothetical protein M0802_013550 [Mischocyttarus mexicanus]
MWCSATALVLLVAVAVSGVFCKGPSYFGLYRFVYLTRNPVIDFIIYASSSSSSSSTSSTSSSASSTSSSSLCWWWWSTTSTSSSLCWWWWWSTSSSLSPASTTSSTTSSSRQSSTFLLASTTREKISSLSNKNNSNNGWRIINNTNECNFKLNCIYNENVTEVDCQPNSSSSDLLRTSKSKSNYNSNSINNTTTTALGTISTTKLSYINKSNNYVDIKNIINSDNYSNLVEKTVGLLFNVVYIISNPISNANGANKIDCCGNCFIVINNINDSCSGVINSDRISSIVRSSVSSASA